MSSYKLVLNDELYHHGIKGQKWGVRRFQNPDGSLTDKGKKRYSDPNHKMGSYDKEKETAEKIGRSALQKYEEIDAKLDKGELTEDQYYEELQKQVYDPIIKVGFEWVSRGAGGNGYKHIQFGRELSDLETKERNGEEWVQEWLVANDSSSIIDLNKEW